MMKNLKKKEIKVEVQEVLKHSSIFSIRKLVSVIRDENGKYRVF